MRPTPRRSSPLEALIMKTRILLSDRQRSLHLDLLLIEAACVDLAAEIWGRAVELSVTLLGRRAMALANRTHRGYLGATDQISFPLPADVPTPDGVDLVGDLLLCPSVIAAQCQLDPPDARPRTGSPDRELALVLCHAFLHLLGHTHGEEQDSALMIREENRLYSKFFSLLDGAFLP